MRIFKEHVFLFWANQNVINQLKRSFQNFKQGLLGINLFCSTPSCFSEKKNLENKTISAPLPNSFYSAFLSLPTYRSKKAWRGVNETELG